MAFELSALKRKRMPAAYVARNCHGNLALAKRKSEGLGSSSSRCRCPPFCNASPLRARSVLREARWR